MDYDHLYTYYQSDDGDPNRWYACKVTKRTAHLPQRPQEARVMGGDLDRFEKPGPPGELVHLAFDEPVHEPGEPAGLVRLDTFHPRHVHHLQTETIVRNR